MGRLRAFVSALACLSAATATVLCASPGTELSQAAGHQVVHVVEVDLVVVWKGEGRERKKKFTTYSRLLLKKEENGAKGKEEKRARRGIGSARSVVTRSHALPR